MKKLFSTLAIVAALALASSNAANAEMGYVDYSTVSKQYSLAVKYSSDLDKKLDDIKSYAQQQDGKLKNAKSKEEVDKIRNEAMKQVENKKKDYETTRAKYEADLTTKVMMASEKVRITKKLDMIIKKDGRVAGGVDCTKDVLNILK